MGDMGRYGARWVGGDGGGAGDEGKGQEVVEGVGAGEVSCVGGGVQSTVSDKILVVIAFRHFDNM